MESPVRKMLKKNDYARHKLLRKIKRQRKARVELDSKAAEKELKRKLKVKLPKFDNGKDQYNFDPSAFDANGNLKANLEITIPEVVVTGHKPQYRTVDKITHEDLEDAALNLFGLGWKPTGTTNEIDPTTGMPTGAGALVSVYPEFDLLTLGRGIRNEITPSVRQLSNAEYDLNFGEISQNALDKYNIENTFSRMNFGNGSGKVVHVDYGDGIPGFASSNTTGSKVRDGFLTAGINPKQSINYSWWFQDKPYATGIYGKGPFLRIIAIDRQPSMIDARSNKVPGAFLKKEVVSNDPVDLSNAITLQYDPITKTWGNVKYVGKAYLKKKSRQK